MTLALLERQLKPYKRPVKNNFLQYLLSSFPLCPIQDREMHRRYAKVIEVLMEAIEMGNLTGEPKEGAEKFISFVAPRMQEYERREFPLGEVAPVDILRFLMEQHGLKQGDLAGELGGQSVVSEILRGKRKLNVEQITRLSRRFGVSPAAFFPAAS